MHDSSPEGFVQEGYYPNRGGHGPIGHTQNETTYQDYDDCGSSLIGADFSEISISGNLNLEAKKNKKKFSSERNQKNQQDNKSQNIEE